MDHLHYIQYIANAFLSLVMNFLEQFSECCHFSPVKVTQKFPVKALMTLWSPKCTDSFEQWAIPPEPSPRKTLLMLTALRRHVWADAQACIKTGIALTCR